MHGATKSGVPSSDFLQITPSNGDAVIDVESLEGVINDALEEYSDEDSVSLNGLHIEIVLLILYFCTHFDEPPLLDFSKFSVDERISVYLYYRLFRLVNQMISLSCSRFGFCHAPVVYRTICRTDFPVEIPLRALRRLFIRQFQDLYLSVEFQDLGPLDITEFIVLDPYNVHLLSRRLSLFLDLRSEGRFVPICYLCGQSVTPPLFGLSNMSLSSPTDSQLIQQRRWSK